MRSLVVLTCLALALWMLPAAAQDFAVENTVNTIHVGTSPESAVISSDGRQLYVANRGGSDISVIDTATGRVSSIPVGASPHGLLLSHDGSRLYALIGGDDPDAALAIINTASQIVAQHITIPRRTDAMVLTPDDRRLYLARVYFGVSSLDVDSGQQYPVTVIPSTCPIGIAISKNGQRLFVNYQCYGPGGSVQHPAHDAIAEYELPSYNLLSKRNDLANVGDQIAISPDGTELWARGEDACSRPDYPSDGCPSLPSRIVNVLRIPDNPRQDMQLLKSYGFSLADFTGRISFSPTGEAFVGGGINLKQIDTRNLEAIGRIPIASAADVVFSPDGNTAYVIVTDKGEVDVLARGRTGNPNLSEAAAALSPAAVTDTLLQVYCPNGQGVTRVSGCSTQAGAYAVQPKVAHDVLIKRGIEEPGKPVERPAPDEDAGCFIAPRLGSALVDPEQLLQTEDRKKVEEYRDFTGKQVNSPDGNEAFFDVTGRLQQDPTVLQKALGKSAVYLSTVVCPNRVATILIRQGDKPIVKVAMDAGGNSPVTREALRAIVTTFLAELGNPCSDPEKLKAVSKQLYDILIPKDFQAILDTALSRAPEHQLTLVWELGDTLRYVPMGALFDGRQYLVERFSSVVVTNLSILGDPQRGDFLALAAGDTNSDQMNRLPTIIGVKSEVEGLFYSKDGAKVAQKIPATILLDDGTPPVSRQFSEKNLHDSLQQLEDPQADQKAHRLIVHIASHFVLNENTGSSYLLTRSGPLSLKDLGDKDRYSFDDVWLVTLSACQTAAAKTATETTQSARTADGREVEGLGYLADASGAHAVVASLWEVNDTSTSRLMNALYGGLQQTESKAEALRQAELKLLNGTALPGPTADRGVEIEPTDAKTPPRSCNPNNPSSYKHPNYWAPFILIGDWH